MYLDYLYTKNISIQYTPNKYTKLPAKKNLHLVILLFFNSLKHKENTASSYTDDEVGEKNV